jgi:hypothetical protein
MLALVLIPSPLATAAELEGPTMPAVTVDNLLELPAVRRVDPATDVARPVLTVTTAPSRYEGLGFPVRRAFAGVNARLLDPFVHMDEMGEVEYGLS